MILVIGCLLALLSAVPTPGAPRAGSAEVAVGALVAGSLGASVWDSVDLLFLSAGLGLGLLTAALAYAQRSTAAATRSRDRDAVPLPSPAIIAGALAAWLMLRNLAVEPGALRVVVAGGASLGLVAVALLLDRARCPLDPRNAVRILSAYGSLALIAGSVAGEVWTPCRTDKCSIAGELLRSVFRSENSVTNWAGLAIAFELVTRVRGLRLLRLGVLVVVLLMSGGRGAVLALVLAFVAAAALSLRTPLVDASRRPTRPRSLLMVASVIVVAMLLASSAAPESFSARGRVWKLALDNVGITSLAGRGTVVWEDLTAGDPVQLSVHSSYLWMLFGGGLVAVALYGALLTSLITRCMASTEWLLLRRLLPITYVLFGGLYGVVWNPATLDEFSVLMLIVLAYGVREPTSTTDPATAAPETRRRVALP